MPTGRDPIDRLRAADPAPAYAFAIAHAPNRCVSGTVRAASRAFSRPGCLSAAGHRDLHRRAFTMDGHELRIAAWPV